MSDLRFSDVIFALLEWPRAPSYYHTLVQEH